MIAAQGCAKLSLFQRETNKRQETKSSSRGKGETVKSRVPPRAFRRRPTGGRAPRTELRHRREVTPSPSRQRRANSSRVIGRLERAAAAGGERERLSRPRIRPRSAGGSASASRSAESMSSRFGRSSSLRRANKRVQVVQRLSMPTG